MSAARIGRIRMKDTNVVPLRRGGQIRDDRRSAFVAHVAASFDSHVAKYGEKPDAMVLVLGGLKQSAEAYWIIRGDSHGGGTTMLAFAVSTLTREIGS